MSVGCGMWKIPQTPRDSRPGTQLQWSNVSQVQ